MYAIDSTDHSLVEESFSLSEKCGFNYLDFSRFNSDTGFKGLHGLDFLSQKSVFTLL